MAPIAVSGQALPCTNAATTSHVPKLASWRVALAARSTRRPSTSVASGGVPARRSLRVTATSASFSPLEEREHQQMEEIRRLAAIENHHLTVADCMTQGRLIVAKADTSIYDALESLVDHRITGMPVVDEGYRVIGVVSDYDLLALDSISGAIASCDTEAAAASVNSATHDLFPAPRSSWKAFREIQKLLSKAQGQTVGDVMTESPLTVRPLTNLEDAARLLLDSKYRRLPVCDEDGKLVGLLTRGNVIRAALMMRRAAEGRGIAPAGGN